MQLRVLLMIPALAVTVTALGVAATPMAAADCNYSGGSTLCASGGSVRGGSAPPPNAPFDPLPCDFSDPLCYYYDDWDPNIYLDPPNVGLGRPGPVDPGYSAGRPGIGGGGIGGGGRPGGGIGGGRN